MPGLIEATSLSLEAARWAVEAAVEQARARRCLICIAVVDNAGHLLSYDRMDGAPLISGPLAQDKAYTAAANGLATHEWWDMIEPHPVLVHGVNKIDRLIVFGGGVSVRLDGAVVGAVGVSGHSTMDQDRDIAQAAVDATVARLQGLPPDLRISDLRIR
jgi:uncharacterized protein GlcG (DUF336 family)